MAHHRSIKRARVILVLAGMLLPARGVALTLDLSATGDLKNSPRTIFLNAGTYEVTPVVGSFTAFSVNSGIAGTWTWSYRYDSPELGEVAVGRPNQACGADPVCADSAADAFATFAESSMFTLTSGANVDFFICDGPDCFSFGVDNTGGVSLNIVPEPSTDLLLAASLLALTVRTSKGRRRCCRDCPPGR